MQIAQISIFDVMEQGNIPEPILKVGDTVYILSLDVVLHGTIGRSWLCKNHDLSQYYGYSIDYDSGLHTVVWDYLIGETVFTNEESATKKAETLNFVKIMPDELRLENCRSFEYTRDIDNYKLTATVAKVGEDRLYEQNFMCYHFLRKYPKKEKRDKEYERLLKNILNETSDRGRLETSEPKLDTLYKVTNELYASREYAEFNRIRG